MKIMYCNCDGLLGKLQSIKSAAKTENFHIIAITETKTKTSPPQLEGYSWIHKNRKDQGGGGVAIAIRNDIINNVSRVENLEDQDQEVLWIEIKAKSTKTYFGVYYGKQEKAQIEAIEREFSQLQTQIHKLKESGEIILTGDFNAKLEINQTQISPSHIQKQFRNGGYLQQLIDNTDIIPTSTIKNEGFWTRENRHKQNEKSIIDYILTTQNIHEQIDYIKKDTEGILRLRKGKKETDHNTIYISTLIELEKTRKY